MGSNIPTGCSPLATYYNEAKFYTKGRGGNKIDTITIHCYVGQVTAQRGCDGFAERSEDDAASCNYVVGYDGSIGVSVPEQDRSWCTSNSANDKRAVTFEIASDSKHPYKVTDEAYNAMILLIADVCKRNHIKRLVWSTKKNDRVKHLNGCNMTVHRDYANKSCPGDYLYNKHGEIAAAVNKLLFPSVFVESFTGSTITASSVATEFKLMEDFEQYGWSYRLTDLVNDQSTKRSIPVRKQKNSLTVNNLTANTPYVLEILAKNTEGDEVSSPRLFFSTLQDHPAPVTNLSMTIDDFTNLDNSRYTLAFSQPTSWGAFGTSIQKGYRVILAVNGRPDKKLYYDNIIKPSGADRITVTKKLAELLNKTSTRRGDSIQIGIQPWVLDRHGNKVFSVYVTYSDPILIPEKALIVNKLFIRHGDSFNRLAVFKSK